MNRLKKIINRPEQDLQILCVRWFRIQYPSVLIHHSPNGGKRTSMEAIRFKQMGVLAGWPDLFIAKQNKSKTFSGLFIEMKSENGKLTDQQKDVLNRLKTEGYFATTINSFEDFQKIVNQYFNFL